MKKIEIEIPDDKRAEWVNGVLTLVDDKHVEFKFKIGDKVRFKTQHTFGHSIITQQIAYEGKSWYRLESIGELSEDYLEPYTEPQDITEQIKTFEDACKWCENNGHDDIVDEWESAYNVLYGISAPDIFAYLKLRIITCALNEGWEPTFTDGEWRYFPWFGIITKEEWDEMDDEDKARCVGRAFYNAFASGGLVCADASNASSNSNTYDGSRLAFKSEELAAYAGKQFIDIYMDFCFKPSQK